MFLTEKLSYFSFCHYVSGFIVKFLFSIMFIVLSNFCYVFFHYGSDFIVNFFVLIFIMFLILLSNILDNFIIKFWAF